LEGTLTATVEFTGPFQVERKPLLNNQTGETPEDAVADLVASNRKKLKRP
jgi:hypothetical protein